MKCPETEIKNLSRKDLNILYWKVKLSTYQIGEIFDVGRKTVSYHMDKHDLDRRTPGLAGKGKNNPNWQGGKKELQCKECRKSFKVNKYDYENGRKYCSRKCVSSARGRQMQGENNPSYKGGKVESDPCRWCGETRMVKPSASERPFCGRKCYDKWQSEYRKGTMVEEDNPMWQENPSREYRYGRNWNGQRRKALDRDNHECQLCKSVKNLEVHHKKPIATFDRSKAKWYKEANDTNNLITLCRSCHAKIHSNEGQSSLGQYGGNSGP